MNRILQLCLAVGLIVTLVGCTPSIKMANPTKETSAMPVVNQQQKDSMTNLDTNNEEQKPAIEQGKNEEEKEVKKKNYHPIVISGIFIGGSLDGIWKDRDEVAENILGNEKYSLYSLNKYLGDGIGSKIYFDATECQLIEVTSEKDFDIDVVGVQAEWNAMPRTTTEEEINKQEYINIISEILKGYSLSEAPVIIKQVVKTDLEGDGVDELLISAENITATYIGENGEVVQPEYFQSRKNTYSIVMLVKNVNGVREYTEVDKFLYLKDGGFPYVNTITSILDLNGDGKMEIVVGYAYYEGHGYKVYEIKENEVDLIFTNINGL